MVAEHAAGWKGLHEDRDEKMKNIFWTICREQQLQSQEQGTKENETENLKPCVCHS